MYLKVVNSKDLQKVREDQEAWKDRQAIAFAGRGCTSRRLSEKTDFPQATWSRSIPAEEQPVD